MSEEIDRTDLTNVEVPQNFTIDNQEPQSDPYVVNNNIVSLGEPPKMKLKKKKTKKGRSPPRNDPARTIWSASDVEKLEEQPIDPEGEQGLQQDPESEEILMMI